MARKAQKRKPSDTESGASSSSEQDEDAEEDAAKAPVSPRPRNMERWPLPVGPGWNNGKRVLPLRRFAAPSGSPSGTTPSQVVAATTTSGAQTTWDLLSRELAGRGGAPSEAATTTSQAAPSLRVLPRQSPPLTEEDESEEEIRVLPRQSPPLTEQDEGEEEIPFPFVRVPSPSALPTPSPHTHLYDDGSPWISFDAHNRRVVDAISRELAGRGGPQIVVRPVQQQEVAVPNRLPYVTDANGRGITPIYIYAYIYIYIMYIYRYI